MAPAGTPGQLLRPPSATAAATALALLAAGGPVGARAQLQQRPGSFGAPASRPLGSAAVADVDPDLGLVGDVDVSDLVGIGGQGLGGIDADRGLDAGQRRQRMQACFRAARARLDSKPEETEAMVGQLMTQMAQAHAASASASSAAPEFTEEQATNQLVFSMVMSCYQTIDASSVEKVRSGGRLSAEDEEAAFKLSAAAPRPSRRQFRLLESVIREEHERHLKEMGPEALPGTLNIIGSSMSTRTKVLYALAVMALLAGAGLWALRRVARSRPPRERSAKAARRVMKAEMRLDKKKQG